MFHDSFNIGFSGFSYVDMIENAKSGDFCALKRIICHDKKAESEALQVKSYKLLFHISLDLHWK